MLNILSVIGTRPEAIKMAPVIKLLGADSEIFSRVCSTGQHREMLAQALDLFAIRPDFSLDLMRPNQTLSGLTSRLIESLDLLFTETRPDWILAQGDTTTVFASSLVAFYHRVPFGHVEAGLRTTRIDNPFPEEMNRRFADMVSACHFCPTEWAADNLRREGVCDEKIHVTGNTVVDALLDIAARPAPPAHDGLSAIGGTKRCVLVTAHRRESFGEPFKELCLGLRDLALQTQNENVHIVFPVHRNPNVREPVERHLGGVVNISLIDPLDYLSIVHLMKRCVLIVTDSGGIQEEAPALKVPVLVMRETTERPEGVEAGVVRLVGTCRAKIVSEALSILREPAAHAAMVRDISPYGDGHAAERIVKILKRRAR